MVVESTTSTGLTRQLGRFVVVGVANTATAFAVIWAVRVGLGTSVWMASAAGYAVATVQSYALNRFWTFDGVGGTRLGAQAAAFVAVNLLCLLIYSSVNAALARWLSLPLATLATIVVVTPLNFVLMRSFVFMDRPASAR